VADVQTAQDEEDNVLILGLLVVAEPSGPASKGHLDVVDGQQRLVTLSLLMASLSWRMQEDKEEAERGRHILHKKVFLVRSTRTDPACRLPPAACRLPPAACRLPPAACRPASPQAHETRAPRILHTHTGITRLPHLAAGG
jgi:hypothetical protein